LKQLLNSASAEVRDASHPDAILELIHNAVWMCSVPQRAFTASTEEYAPELLRFKPIP